MEVAAAEEELVGLAVRRRRGKTYGWAVAVDDGQG
jgi:hypothetical protein